MILYVCMVSYIEKIYIEAPVSFVKPFRTALRFLQNTHRRVKEKAERIDAILTRATASYRAVIRGRYQTCL